MLAFRIVATVLLAVVGISMFLVAVLCEPEKRGSSGYTYIVIAMFIQALGIGALWLT